MRNSLTQDKKTLLLGSSSDIEALANKEKADILVVSDSHGDSIMFSTILSHCGKDCDALLFCGDGEKDIASMIEKARNEKSFEDCLPPVIGFVAGNTDYGEFTIKNPDYIKAPSTPPRLVIKVPGTAIIVACSHRIFMAHGHQYGINGGPKQFINAARENNANIALYGHTHVAGRDYYGETLFLNPGSPSQPRGGQPPCYARLKINKNEIGFTNIIYQIGAKTDTAWQPPSLRQWWF